MRRFPVICGPTAGGKSTLAVDVALALAQAGTGAEIVTADAFQIYRRMDIGTAKPTPAERRGITHHLIDLVEPSSPERFTVADWLEAADRAIAEIAGRGRVPIVVGGTHLYIKGFLEGMFEGPAPDPRVREELARVSPAQLRAELERVDPPAAARIHPSDTRRTVRAIEVYRQTGVPISEHQRQWDSGGGERRARLVEITGREPVLVGIDWPPEELNRRINARVRGMVDAGLVDEVRALWSAGELGEQASEALGYKQLIEHLSGRVTLTDAIERVKIDTRHLGKSQRTWLRRLRTTPGSVWIDAASTPAEAWAGAVLGACA